jgi:hypothetical protein
VSATQITDVGTERAWCGVRHRRHASSNSSLTRRPSAPAS